ncbi:toll/interleukin-1 receptor domain-containing protein [Geodermatophilus sp. URMC 62]|uniref:toll/interleukin-1 receptor domain-containing protein n=1 Tax=Geodermatophilus sp. URMC 62 TaxID=3423414 RepID=UPI00406C16FE
MKVFISWSGAESRQIAEAIHEWLPAMFETVQPYMSARDNEAGVRWANVVSGHLNDSDFGILCLTPENLQAPWLLFEAGALSKAVDVGRVVPLLHRLGPSDVTTPLTQFQMKDLSEEGIRDLVWAINSVLTFPRSELALTRAFRNMWPDLKEQVGAIKRDSTKSTPHRSDRELLEEVLGIIRAIEAPTKTSRGRGLTADHQDVFELFDSILSKMGSDHMITILRDYPTKIELIPQTTGQMATAYRMADTLRPIADALDLKVGVYPVDRRAVGLREDLAADVESKWRARLARSGD